MTVHTGRDKYIPVHTRTVRLYVLKKVQTGLEPAIFCILLAVITPTLRDTDLDAGIFAVL